MPISRADKQAMLDQANSLATNATIQLQGANALINRIAAIVPDDLPSKHTMATLNNQSVINLFAKVVGLPKLEAGLTVAQKATLYGNRTALYTGPAVEDFANLTAAEKAAIIAALG